jgi:hypothetical protein
VVLFTVSGAFGTARAGVGSSREVVACTFDVRSQFRLSCFFFRPEYGAMGMTPSSDVSCSGRLRQV